MEFSAELAVAWALSKTVAHHRRWSNGKYYNNGKYYKPVALVPGAWPPRVSPVA